MTGKIGHRIDTSIGFLTEDDRKFINSLPTCPIEKYKAELLSHISPPFGTTPSELFWRMYQYLDDTESFKVQQPTEVAIVGGIGVLLPRPLQMREEYMFPPIPLEDLQSFLYQSALCKEEKIFFPGTGELFVPAGDHLKCRHCSAGIINGAGLLATKDAQKRLLEVHKAKFSCFETDQRAALAPNFEGRLYESFQSSSAMRPHLDMVKETTTDDMETILMKIFPKCDKARKIKYEEHKEQKRQKLGKEQKVETFVKPTTRSASGSLTAVEKAKRAQRRKANSLLTILEDPDQVMRHKSSSGSEMSTGDTPPY